MNLVLEPIYSTAVWGAGWYNAASAAHYADNAIRFEGNLDFELQGDDDLWDFLGDWFIRRRAYPKSFDISPDGARVYRYWTGYAYENPTYFGPSYLGGAWNTSVSMNTSEGSFVTCSAGVVALDRDEVDPAGGSAFSEYTYIRQVLGVIADNCSGEFSSTNPLNPSGNNVDPIPYWRTLAQLLTGSWSAPFSGGSAPQSGLETVEWSVDLTHNHVILYTCDGDRLPTAVLMGPADVTGSVILYNQDGVFDPILGPAHTGTLTTPYLYAENTWFRVTITRNAGNVYIELPAVVVESDDYGIPGADAVVNRTFGLKGLGGRCYNNYVIPPMVMSDHTGAFPAPI